MQRRMSGRVIQLHPVAVIALRDQRFDRLRRQRPGARERFLGQARVLGRIDPPPGQRQVRDRLAGMCRRDRLRDLRLILEQVFDGQLAIERLRLSVPA